MESASRHQCLLYAGPPSRHLPTLAAVMREKLDQRYRCLYLNTNPMVAGMRSYLAAAGVDVERELELGSLVLSSEQSHLVEGLFDSDHMLDTLERTLEAALREGYAGLFASGDMTWELGPARDFGRLLQYELALEEMFQRHPELSGICQYHAETIPREFLRQGLLSHRAIFVNETLSLINPHYIALGTPMQNPSAAHVELDAFMRTMVPEAETQA